MTFYVRIKDRFDQLRNFLSITGLNSTTPGVCTTMSDMDDFVESLDPGLLTYKDELFMRSVTSNATLRYLRPREVKDMKIPDVYKRLLIDKILNLQSPETKKLLKEESSPFVNSKPNSSEKSSDDQLQPKRLKFNDEALVVEQEKTDSKLEKSDGYLENEVKRLSEERDTLTLLLVHKKDELKTMVATPTPPEPLAIPGNNVSKFICDNCHHRGHKSNGNRGNKSCPFFMCAGYHFCGILSKHKEFKQQISEVEKEVSNLDKEVKSITNQIDNTKTFLSHNATNFIVAIKPHLKAVFPSRYNGRQGTQLLQKDIRYLKIALGGKIPDSNDVSRENLEKWINQGKSQITMTCGVIDEMDMKIDKVTSASATSIQNSNQSSTTAAAHISLPYTSSQGNFNMQPAVWPQFLLSPPSLPQTGFYGCPYLPVHMPPHMPPSCTVTSENSLNDILPPLPPYQQAEQPPLPDEV